ncbi:MAG: hypothetical protein LBI59_01385 [Candidatus Accumulibacter sp.]|nr:hypothetical protein [Accumulibacter sp.]
MEDQNFMQWGKKRPFREAVPCIQYVDKFATVSLPTIRCRMQSTERYRERRAQSFAGEEK